MNGLNKVVLVFALVFVVVLLSVFVGEAMMGDTFSNGRMWHGNIGGIGWM